MYVLYRMLRLFNFPFTTGRKLHWFTELEPVASERLRQMVNVTEGKLQRLGFIAKGASLHKSYNNLSLVCWVHRKIRPANHRLANEV